MKTTETYVPFRIHLTGHLSTTRC